MKNTKLIALVAVLVVVGVIVSVAITNGTIANNNAELKQELADNQTTIDALNATIEKLNAGLISYEQAMKELEEKGIELKNWTEATNQLPAKLAALEKAYADFKASVVVYDEDNKTVLVNFVDKFNTFVDEDEKVLFDNASIFGTLYTDAQDALLRATSVAEMDAIIAGFTADCKAVPTMLQSLYTTLETVEKNGVEYSDYENILLAIALYEDYITNDNVYAPATEEAKGEKEVIGERIDALLDGFKPLIVEKFIELVKALPRVELLAPSHYEAVEAARTEANRVVEYYGADAKKLETNSKGKATDYAKALTALAAAEARVAVVKTIEQHAKDLNEFLAKAFDKETLKKEGITYGANIETYNYLDFVGEQIEKWIKNRAIVTDTKDEDYSAELYNLVNHNVYDGYVTKFETVVAELRAKADAFIAAVGAIENVNLDSKATLDAAKVLFDTVSKGMLIEDIDTILGLDDYYDDVKEEDVDVTGVADSYDAWLTLYHNYNWLVDTKAELEKAVKDTLIECKKQDVHGKKDQHGDIVVCDCEDVGTYAYKNISLTFTDYNGTVRTFDSAIVEIIAMYGLDETVFDAKLLEQYKLARLQATLDIVTGRLNNAYEASTDSRKETLKKSITEEILGVAANYTFAAEFECQDKDNKKHECHCAEDLANWSMAIVGEPANTLAEKYTQDILNNRFYVVAVEPTVE